MAGRRLGDGRSAVGTGARRCEVPRAPHQGAGKAKMNCDALLISPPAGSVRAIAILTGGVAPGYRTGLRKAGTGPRSREHIPSEVIAAKRVRACVRRVGACLLEVLSAWYVVARSRACGRCRGLGSVPGQGRRAPPWCHLTHPRPGPRRGPVSGPHRA